MWCTTECWFCNDKSCEHYSPNLDEFGHDMILKTLELRYLGKTTPDGTEIIEVKVDYRKDYQYMNRVVDEYGCIYFISDLEKKKGTNEDE